MAEPKWKKWLEPENLILLNGWARDGLTDEQIAHNMGIGIRTLYNWKKNKECLQIMQAIKNGKEVVDYVVENALLKQAQSGNVTAQIFWLKNRKPDKWRDKRDPETPAEVMNYANDILVKIAQAACDADTTDEETS